MKFEVEFKSNDVRIETEIGANYSPIIINNYEDLKNKPILNGKEIAGSKTSCDYRLLSDSDKAIALSNIEIEQLLK